MTSGGGDDSDVGGLNTGDTTHNCRFREQQSSTVTWSAFEMRISLYCNDKSESSTQQQSYNTTRDVTNTQKWKKGEEGTSRI